MRLRSLLLIFALSIQSAKAELLNFESQDLSFEYGLAYHTLMGRQRDNDSWGRLTSPQYPYWTAAYSKRIGKSYALRAYGGIQFVRFDRPLTGNILRNENQVLNHFGLEMIQKISPLWKASLFLMQQDHPLYFAKTPTEFQITKAGFAQSGFHLNLGQRRRVGLLWGLGAKAYLIFPTRGGDVVTETGLGGEAYARLGWVGPLGALYQLKGFYQATSAPNADINFTHQILAYCLHVSHSF